MPYTGSFDVENGDFTLYAQAFILRENEIAFLFTGHDEYGQFRIEGVAQWTDHGFYMASNCEMIRPNYADADIASIKFIHVEENDNHTRCNVVGSWIQEGDAWEFTGLLNMRV